AGSRITAEVRELCCPKECRTEGGVGFGGGPRNGMRQPLLALAARSSKEPEGSERSGQTQFGIGTADLVSAPFERGAKVIPLRLQSLEPQALMGAKEDPSGLFGESQVVVSVPSSNCRCLARDLELLRGVLTNGLEHSITRLVCVGRG